MGQQTQFFARRFWSYGYLVFGLFVLLDSVLLLLTSDSWWRRLLGVPVIPFAAWWVYLGWLARRRPIVRVSDEMIENRPLGTTRAATPIRRGDVVGVAWSYPADIGVRLRDGATVRILVHGLAPRDKEALGQLIGSASSG